MAKNTPQTKEASKGSEVPRSEAGTSVYSLLDPQDSTGSPLASTQPSPPPANSTQPGSTADDESEENKSYVRGYNDALADLSRARRGSAPQAPSSPQSPRSSQTPSSTGFCPFHEIWYGEDSEDDDGENIPGHPDFMRAHRAQMRRRHSEHMQQLGNTIRVSMGASPRRRRTRRSQSSRDPAGVSSSSGSYQGETDYCSCCDREH